MLSVASVVMNASMPRPVMTAPLTRPTTRPDEHAGGGGDQRARAGISHDHGRDHAAQAEHGSDRDIDAASEDHQGLADRHDADSRRLLQDIESVGDRQKIRRKGREDQHEDEERDIETVPREKDDRSEPVALQAGVGRRDRTHFHPRVAASRRISSVASVRAVSRTMRPSRITRIRSLMRKTSGRYEETTTTPAPCLASSSITR